MATTAELQKKLIAKLKELFQLDQPDLDFGFYRVMHVKQKEISDYLENQLPLAIAAAFKDSSGAAVSEKDAAYHAAVAQAQSFGAPDPEATEPVKKAKAAWEDAKNGAGAEADVYDHLYHFFERYYDKGDFVSLRYLTRETDRKAKPYAIPYAGEEVMLHWANSDQYYIKTSENFSHFSFDAAKHPDVVKMDALAKLAAKVPETLKVHFEIVDAEEGDHGNIKQGKDRFFILHDEKKCEVKDGEVYVYFEYREDPEMSGQSAKWQERRRAEAVNALKTALSAAGLSDDLLAFLYINLDDGVRGKPPRILLDVYLKRYFARNTEDYFIHKDLGGFLRRELDFYIKNDLMVLDNVVSATPESVAKWLGTLKVFRKIAEDIIAFLAQLEDFQKKLWLKKKFIVQCDYCITMDRVPAALKPEVLANQKQLDAWKALNTDADPKAEDMTAIDARMVDTQYFDESFKQKLVASIDDFDEQCDGVLIHGDNFQGLCLTRERYNQSIDFSYIDPPYNTAEGEFPYKDSYRNSSWMSMMYDRICAFRWFGRDDARFFVSIDDRENANLLRLLYSIFGEENYLGAITWEKRTKSQNTSTAKRMLQSKVEFIHPFAFTLKRQEFNLEKVGEKVYPLHSNSLGDYRLAKMEVSTAYKRAHDTGSMIYEIEGILPGEGKSWQLGKDSVDKAKKEGRLFIIDNWPWIAYRPEDEDSNIEKPFWSHFFDKEVYGTAESGKKVLATDMGFGEVFKTVKPVPLISKIMFHSATLTSTALDYFAGSGTTAHAVIDLNRQDGGKRKYILIEMGDHFDTVLMPRVQKVVYSPDWKDGKPTAGAKGVSHCFKYFRLESYEDALNNLQVDSAKGAAFAGVGDYFFKYMLDVETKGSPSLLNIEQFSNPFGYKLVVKKPGSEEREERTVDLVETFNYLIGLRVKHTAATVGYNAEFERAVDPELPTDVHTKLTIKGKIKLDEAGPWKFRTVEGWCPKNRATPNDGAKERVLIVWRTLTGDSEKDNAVLNAFLQRKDVNALDGEFDVIYVNGSNNVPNLKKENDVWKVRLIEEDFRARMWEGA